MWIRCREASRLISESMDRRLPLKEEWALHMHLWICNMCRNYKKQLRILRQLVNHWWEGSDHDSNAVLPQDAKERLKLRLKAR